MPYHLMLAATSPLLNMFLKTSLLLPLYFTWKLTVFNNLLNTYLVSSIYPSVSRLGFYHECRSLIGYVAFIQECRLLIDYATYYLFFVDSE